MWRTLMIMITEIANREFGCVYWVTVIWTVPLAPETVAVMVTVPVLPPRVPLPPLFEAMLMIEELLELQVA
jgi:hypothetical protein